MDYGHRLLPAGRVPVDALVPLRFGVHDVHEYAAGAQGVVELERGLHESLH